MTPKIGDIWRHTSTNFEVIYYLIYEVEEKEVGNTTGYTCLVQMYNGLCSYITTIWFSPSNDLWEKLA